LRREVARGEFRADLYFRLNVIPIRVAPLRERPDDVLPLAQHFLAYHSAQTGREISLSREAELLLLNYTWPGNVRELENTIERAVVLSGADVLTPDAFALEPLLEDDREQRPVATPLPQIPMMTESLQDCLDRAAACRIKLALEEANGNRAEAAAALGVDRTTLYRVIKRLGL